MSLRRAIVVIGLVAGAVRPGQAQRVRGTVRDGAAGRPIAGAVVSVTDSAGRVLAHSLGGASGRFAVFRPAGSARLRVVHIGYRPRDIAIGRDPADSTIDVVMTPIVQVLGVVRSSSDRVCPGDVVRDSVGGALALWEQARTALLATVIARESRPPRLQLRSFRREREPMRRVVTKEDAETKYVVGDRSYVAARPAWALADEGYMHEDLGGTRAFYAPDEDVLLDPSFAATHCFHVESGNASHAGDVGIAFEPVHDARRDTLVDITGVLWVDRRLAALRSLEFKYTNLEPAADRSDGKIVFQVMPGGVTMIQQWMIRSTTVAIDRPVRPPGVRRRPRDRPDRTDARTIGYQEVGGLVAEAVWPDGTHWHADLPRVVGVVVDTTGAPAAGIRVWSGRSTDTVTTRADGTFELPYVTPGLYFVYASDSVLASQGISSIVPRPAMLTRAAATGDTYLRLELHPRSEVLSLVCPSQSYKPGTGVLLAHVVGGAGDEVPDAQVTVDAQQSIVAGDTVPRRVHRTGVTDDDGRFVVCGAALDQEMVVHATKGRAAGSVTIAHWPGDVLVVTMTLAPPSIESRPP